ncbi:terminase small subunit [Salipiger sp. PrR003]|uniref:terminase small subunit n=1 Tax=Salipiger sp. PrR003 TaxID=2706776 RepID=UPI0013DAB471|nr:terminase small subunit [Salipiger sp. PrR003]NDV52121.1 terminase small subunit [Salipiger sp. PrR003]
MSDQRDPDTGRFLPGHRFWEARSSHGRKPTFADADTLWEACVEYFAWVEGNPLREAKAFSYEGRVTLAELPKLRAMTISGLCLFLDIASETWRGWKTEGHALYRPDLVEMISRVEAVIYEQKFTGAAADLLNPSIISRELGLAEKNEHSGPNGGPVEVRTLADFYGGKGG